MPQSVGTVPPTPSVARRYARAAMQRAMRPY